MKRSTALLPPTWIEWCIANGVDPHSPMYSFRSEADTIRERETARLASLAAEIVELERMYGVTR